MLGVFTIRDSAAEAFLRPFFAQSKGAAIRSFSDEVNGGDTPIAAHPDDYTLFELGTFDELKGEFEIHEPRTLGLGSTFVIQGSKIPLTLEAQSG